MRRMFKEVALGVLLAVWLGLTGVAADETSAPAAAPKPAASSVPPATPAPTPAQAPPPPAPAKPVPPDNAILGFVKANPDCSEITDECIVCAVVSGKAMCSTPGIACVRKDLRCVTKQPATPKQ
jgi:hypothetical protein